MATEPDDEALRWAGDTDPTLDAPVLGRTGTADAGRALPDDRALPDGGALPDGWSRPTPLRPQAAPAAAPGASAAPGTVAASAPGSVALVGMGILAGVYLLYTIGWFISASRVDNPLGDPVGAFMFSLGAWLAVAAPVIWFGAAVWLTDGRPRARAGWLIAGVVLLAPVPVILGVGGVS